MSLFTELSNTFSQRRWTTRSGWTATSAALLSEITAKICTKAKYKCKI